MTNPLRHWWASATAPLLTFGAAKLAVHLATNGVYGFQRDEMYYVASGNHPSLGYVDYPLVAPMLARLDTTLFGTSPWTLRLVPSIVGAALVVLTGLCARQMGGGRGTQALAAFLALVCPLLLGANWLFQTVTLDQLTWLAVIYLFLRLIDAPSARGWLALGAAAGVGLETKFTILALCAGVAVSVATSPRLRGQLRTRWPWLAAALAVLIAVPNLAWQVTNGFPSLTYIRNHSSDIAQSGGVLAFVGSFLLFVGPVVLPVWVAGWALLAGNPRLRPAGVMCLVAILVLLPEGKAYYPAPTILLVLAAGCVAAAGLVGRRRRWTVGLVVAASLVETAVLLPIELPLVPTASLHATRLDSTRQDFADTVGWPDLARQVAAAYLSLPVAQRYATTLVAANYGEAGAIEIYGPRLGLPSALSGELSFWYWKPGHVAATTFLGVGFAPGDLRWLCGQVRQVGAITIPDGVTNQEQGAPIVLCTGLRESLDAAWPSFRHFQ